MHREHTTITLLICKSTKPENEENDDIILLIVTLFSHLTVLLPDGFDKDGSASRGHD